MPAWSIYAVAAAVFIGAHYLTLRAASGRIGDALGAMLLEGTAALGLLVLLLAGVGGRGPTTAPGVAWSCVSGLCISGAMMLLFFALRAGGPVSATGPIVLGGGVTLAALVAPIVFSSEAFTWRRGAGIALGFVAIAILATERR
jgi:bacterial/archaeal transporter family protein